MNRSQSSSRQYGVSTPMPTTNVRKRNTTPKPKSEVLSRSMYGNPPRTQTKERSSPRSATPTMYEMSQNINELWHRVAELSGLDIDQYLRQSPERKQLPASKITTRHYHKNQNSRFGCSICHPPKSTPLHAEEAYRKLSFDESLRVYEPKTHATHRTKSPKAPQTSMADMASMVSKLTDLVESAEGKGNHIPRKQIVRSAIAPSFSGSYRESEHSKHRSPALGSPSNEKWAVKVMDRIHNKPPPTFEKSPVKSKSLSRFIEEYAARAFSESDSDESSDADGKLEMHSQPHKLNATQKHSLTKAETTSSEANIRRQYMEMKVSNPDTQQPMRSSEGSHQRMRLHKNEYDFERPFLRQALKAAIQVRQDGDDSDTNSSTSGEYGSPSRTKQDQIQTWMRELSRTQQNDEQKENTKPNRQPGLFHQISQQQMQSNTSYKVPPQGTKTIDHTRPLHEELTHMKVTWQRNKHELAKQRYEQKSKSEENAESGDAFWARSVLRLKTHPR
eukprot:TRINITY_DN13130_c0_g1_i1.p1 TRINITY_DN13130_c0_g1~~TRINITY_DN13130_c0_g1_i1.p1  ORF type:complete len:503 (-),score=94.05 TRINITY_DN13130_c0_g1_i1:310-1818(-)